MSTSKQLSRRGFLRGSACCAAAAAAAVPLSACSGSDVLNYFFDLEETYSKNGSEEQSISGSGSAVFISAASASAAEGTASMTFNLRGTATLKPAEVFSAQWSNGQALTYSGCTKGGQTVTDLSLSTDAATVTVAFKLSAQTTSPKGLVVAFTYGGRVIKYKCTSATQIKATQSARNFV